MNAIVFVVNGFSRSTIYPVFRKYAELFLIIVNEGYKFLRITNSSLEIASVLYEKSFLLQDVHLLCH